MRKHNRGRREPKHRSERPGRLADFVRPEGLEKLERGLAELIERGHGDCCDAPPEIKGAYIAGAQLRGRLLASPGKVIAIPFVQCRACDSLPSVMGRYRAELLGVAESYYRPNQLN